MRSWIVALVSAMVLALVVDVVTAQPPGQGPRGRGRPGLDARGPEARRPEARGPGPWPGPFRGPEGQMSGPGFRPLRMPLMVALDADEDGEISAEEIKNAVEALKKLDKDDDGKLSREELRPELPEGAFRPGGRGGPGGPGSFPGPFGPRGEGEPRWRGSPDGRGGPAGPGWRRQDGPPGMGRGGFSIERLMRFDEDGDGKVTKEELPEPMQRLLERGDADDDGAIDREEAEKLAAEIERLRRERPGGPGGESFVERLMNLDRDGDGKITKDEMPEWMRERMLERGDTNGDGALDKEEAERMAEQFERRGGGPPPGAGPGGRPERPRRPSEE